VASFIYIFLKYVNRLLILLKDPFLKLLTLLATKNENWDLPPFFNFFGILPYNGSCTHVCAGKPTEKGDEKRHLLSYNYRHKWLTDKST
jgi:hypothetical protein